jgi:uncharacterized protein
MSKILNIKSTSSVKNYIEFLESVYLLFELFKYDYSLKKQYVSNKKVYAIDNGLRNVVAFKHSADSGRLLENLVFIELLRRGKTVYYHKLKYECDFILEENGKINAAIQVCMSLNAENKARETGALIETAALYNLHEASLISYDQEENMRLDGLLIRIVPAWKWLLGILGV